MVASANPHLQSHWSFIFSLGERGVTHSLGNIPWAGESRYLLSVVDCICLGKHPIQSSRRHQSHCWQNPTHFLSSTFSKFALSIFPRISFFFFSFKQERDLKSFLRPKTLLGIDHFVVFWWFLFVLLNILGIYTPAFTCEILHFSASLAIWIYESFLASISRITVSLTLNF